jgi:hypothetical protein
MGGRDSGYLGGILNFSRWKQEAKWEEKEPRRSHSEPPTGTGRRRGQGKLYKTPPAQMPERPRTERPDTEHPYAPRPRVDQPRAEPPLERPRNRLRKSMISLVTIPQPATSLFVLEYEPYPHLVQPGKVLGIYSTFDAVTLGALKHGAYTFSREGMLDGSEYLSPTGRIRLVQTTVQYSGTKAMLPERSRSLDGEPLRLDIPHPESQEEKPRDLSVPREPVYLAVRQGPNAASWIGVFEDKSLAWGACLKDKAMCATSDELCDEKRSIGLNNMPQVSGRLVGSGRFTWMVKQHIIDAYERGSADSNQQTWRDV